MIKISSGDISPSDIRSWYIGENAVYEPYRQALDFVTHTFLPASRGVSLAITRTCSNQLLAWPTTAVSDSEPSY